MKKLVPFVVFVLIGWGPALAFVLLFSYGIGHPVFVPNDDQVSALVIAWVFSFVGSAILQGVTE